jgi:Ca2+-binding EF-hand superfamily protein
MEIKVTAEDISELFNHIEDGGENKIRRAQFTGYVSQVLQRVQGGTNANDSNLIKGVRTTQKGGSNIQLVLQIMKQICDGIQDKKLTIRQLHSALDVNATGFLTRGEFEAVCRSLVRDPPGLALDHARQLTSYFDEQGRRGISISEFLKLCIEVLNQ